MWTQSHSYYAKSLRVILPVWLLGVVGGLILVVTEDEESDIMQSYYPFTTAFYTSVITSLSIGYGDYYPTSAAGRALFIFFIPASVVGMITALEELNAFIKYLRTTRTVEIVPIRDILHMVTKPLLLGND
jgi:hypothetical protein